MESAELGIRGRRGGTPARRKAPATRSCAAAPVLRARSTATCVARRPRRAADAVVGPGPRGPATRSAWSAAFYNTTIDTILDIDDRVGSRDVRSTAGTLSAGLTLPLWTDRAIDRRRANLRQTKMELDRACRSVRDAQLLDARGRRGDAATGRGSRNGLRLEIEQTLLELAQTRDEALSRRIELGALDPLAGVDNRRLILDREGRVVAAERAFQQAGLDPSLFLRNSTGNPVVPGAERPAGGSRRRWPHPGRRQQHRGRDQLGARAPA